MRDWLSYLWYEVGYWASTVFLTLGFSLRHRGRHRIPRRGPALIIANHQSFLDPIAVGSAARRHLYYLARKTLFTNWLAGWYLRSVNVIPVDQEGIPKEGLRAILDQLQAGHAVLIFPEGERTYKGNVQPLKPGIQLLIKRTEAPIIPVGVAGAFDAFSRWRKWPLFSPRWRPATKGAIAVFIGRPLDPRHFRDWPRDRLLAELHQQLEIVKEQAERLRRKP
jgi:1-acyl-sn-glycerol-3-phosphate acyltransferase